MKQLNWKSLFLFAVSVYFIPKVIAEEAVLKETLPSLQNNVAPQNFDELWSGFDPRKEPLEIETMKEWEEDGVVLKVVRFRIGVFKGQKAKLAAVYGYPKSGTKLPGLLQIHGGGQYADYKAPLYNAKRGYATISISWAGRISAPGYSVNPDVVKMFWENETKNPRYKLTTDWGALDAYHAPSRNSGNSFLSVKPAPWTLDSVDSPRNCPWFLCTLAARRALTFLEQQPEVDKDKLGVYGHSMGGKLTVMTAAADNRVKAAAPSCGGISDRDNESELYRNTIGDEVYLKRINCPIVFLSPSNDFHGRINDLESALFEIKTKNKRVTISPHANHQDNAAFETAGPLWFDQWLKRTFQCPGAPRIGLHLNSDNKIPSILVRIDQSRKIIAIDVYYTQQVEKQGEANDRVNTIHRFWHHVNLKNIYQDFYAAPLPILTNDKPLWAFANVLYELDEPVSAAGYYYRPFKTKVFNLSSRPVMKTVKELVDAGVKVTAKKSLLIEDFKGDWEKEWFTYREEDWARKTHKVYSPKWKAPANAKLAVSVRSANPNQLVIGIDEFASQIEIKDGNTWQEILLSPADFKDVNDVPLTSWESIKELRLSSMEILRTRGRGQRKSKKVGAEWQGPKPEFKELRWIEAK